MNPFWNNVDFSMLAFFARHPLCAKIIRKIGILSEKRFTRLQFYDLQIIRWNVRKGIPFNDNTFDVVYHSHFLEHLDKKAAVLFLYDCYRVLKPQGVIRVVVPDLSAMCRRYIASFEVLEKCKQFEYSLITHHEESVGILLDQIVTTEPAGTAEQPFFVRIIERFVRGNAARAGEMHRWMYDKYTLGKLLGDIGFKDISAERPETGRINGWSEYHLDTNENGSIYKPNSIYMEAIK
jgi:SAM-dependent methyltransferase